MPPPRRWSWRCKDSQSQVRELPRSIGGVGLDSVQSSATIRPSGSARRSPPSSSRASGDPETTGRFRPSSLNAALAADTRPSLLLTGGPKPLGFGIESLERFDWYINRNLHTFPQHLQRIRPGPYSAASAFGETGRPNGPRAQVRALAPRPLPTGQFSTPTGETSGSPRGLSSGATMSPLLQKSRALDRARQRPENKGRGGTPMSGRTGPAAGESPSLGQELAAIRQQKGWTLERVEAASKGQVSYGYVSDIERDEVLPSRKTLDILATALGADPRPLIRKRDRRYLVEREGIEPVLADLALLARELEDDPLHDELLERLSGLLDDVSDALEREDAEDPTREPARETARAR